MPRFYPEPAASDPDILKKPGATGILLANLGTPEHPDSPSVRRYLGEFLSDPRVIEAPRLIWKLVLHGIILRTRPKKVARAYSKIWTEEGSPLLAMTRNLATALENRLPNNDNAPVFVRAAMCYGSPSFREVLDELKQMNLKRLLVIPLYPQYSATTTAAAIDQLNKVLQTWRVIPEYRVVSDYHDHPLYIEALAKQINAQWSDNGSGRKLLFSFHGLPQEYVDKGDIYQQHCLQTANLVAKKLELGDDQWQTAFQSRFGPKEWLKPYTDVLLEDWAKQGVNSVDVICPGFAIDCLETLEEIDMQNRELFMENGGVSFHYIPALNDGPLHVNLMHELVRSRCADWISD